MTDIEKRIQRAEELFMQGFNCAQSVVAAYADMYGYTEEQALAVSAGFGGGIGRMRLTCGAACGMFTLAGMHCGTTKGDDRQGKSDCYKVVQQLAQRFTDEFGTLTCSDLLKLKKDAPITYEASERTAEYYRSRPCVNQVITAARIWGEYILST